MGHIMNIKERMNIRFICHSELCVVIEDCECGSDCCRGVKTKPLIIEYVNDNLVTTNNHIKTTDQELIYNLVIGHECPFCIAYVEC